MLPRGVEQVRDTNFNPDEMRFRSAQDFPFALHLGHKLNIFYKKLDKWGCVGVELYLYICVKSALMYA